MKNIIIALITVLTLTACGSSKKATGISKDNAAATLENNKELRSIDYLRKISDNAIYSQNVVSPINLAITAMGKNFSVSGKLQMRKNEVIRITLTPFGLMEAGRIEFTPDYVLIVDRMHRQYIKATYQDISFLKSNGMDFYTLQSLFWNELFIPRKKSVVESDLTNFTVDMTTQQNRPVTLKSGSLDFKWTTDVEQSKIKDAQITYRKGTAQESAISFTYDDFVPMGTKRFPSKEVLTFNSNAAATSRIVLDIEMNRISDDTNWETRTKVSDRYTKVSADEVLAKIIGQ